jgi:hypothetical protein
MPSPINKTAAKVKKSADLLSHAIAGTASAKARPKKQICGDRKLTPAKKAPSASNVKSTRLIAGTGNIVRSPGSSTMFIVNKIAIRWSAGEPERIALLACPEHFPIA